MFRKLLAICSAATVAVAALAGTRSAIAVAGYYTAPTPTTTNYQSSTVPPLRGIYVVDGVHSNNTLDPTMLADPNLDGFLLRLSWAQLEPTEGNYSWTVLDNQIAQAAGANKKVTIAVGVGWQAPSWVFTDGAKAYKWIWDSNFAAPICSVQQMPVPWDPVFLSKWETFVKAFGARYNSNPTVAAVKISTVSSESWETSLPTSVKASISNGKTSCTGYDNVTDWQKAGYTRTLMETTWDTIMAGYSTAFPNKQIISMLVPAGFPPIDEYGKIFSGKEHAISEYIVSSGAANYGFHYGAQNNALSSQWIWPTLGLYTTSITTGYQMLKSMGSQLNAAATLGINAGGQYLEIYKSDLENSSLTSTVANLHATLK